MELKQLKYFYDVLRLHSFTAAARANNVSQSAVSQKVKALETEMGVPLLNRGHKDFTATPAGAKLYGYAEAILSAADQAAADVRREASGRGVASLTVGSLADGRMWEPAASCALFASRHPETKVTTVYGTSIQLQRALLAGSVDAAVADAGSQFADYFVSVPVAAFYTHVLIARPLAAQLPSESLMPAQIEVTARALRGVPCITYAGLGTEAGEAGDDCLSPAPTRYAVRIVQQSYLRDMLGLTGPLVEAGSFGEALGMVATGRGFMVGEAASPTPPHGELIRTVPLVGRGGPVRHEYLLLSARAHPLPALDEYGQVIRQVFADTAAEWPGA